MEKDYEGGELVEGKVAYIKEYDVGITPDQTEKTNLRYGSCEVAKELEGKFKNAFYKLVYVDNGLACLDMSSLDDVYNMLQRGNEYLSYLIAARAYKPKRQVHDGYCEAPTTILSKAIEQVEQMGDHKVMVALVDLDDTNPKEERLYTFCDIESKKLRKVIYKEMEKEI